VKLEKWQTYQIPAVIQGAIRLYELLGGSGNLTEKRDIWRDDSLAGKSPVYAVTHGYRLGAPDRGLAVKFVENWTQGASGDSHIGTVLEIRSDGGPRLFVRYRHGQLLAEAEISPDMEALCHSFFV